MKDFLFEVFMLFIAALVMTGILFSLVLLALYLTLKVLGIL